MNVVIEFYRKGLYHANKSGRLAVNQHTNWFK